MKAGAGPTAWFYSPFPVPYQPCLDRLRVPSAVSHIGMHVIGQNSASLSLQVSECHRNIIRGTWQPLS